MAASLAEPGHDSGSGHHIYSRKQKSLVQSKLCALIIFDFFPIYFLRCSSLLSLDLKQNLLLDENGDLKIFDFGISALHETRRPDGLLHTMCGTPTYVTPEVISKRGYDGTKADIWAYGGVLYVLLAGFLPFQDHNLMEMYKKISKGEFRCPQWFPPEARKLLVKILDPSPKSRIPLPKIMDNCWFKKGFKLTIARL